jgi:imidazolonepropionase-like amidohydrolase
MERARAKGARDEQEAFALQQYEILLQNFARLVERGAEIVCGTDAGVRDTPFEDTWLEYALMVRSGLPPVEGLRAASTRAARALLIDDHVGRIAPGYEADLIALRRDPLRDPEAFSQIDLVMRGGVVVYGGCASRAPGGGTPPLRTPVWDDAR